ncbi:MAG: hypothetical protein L3J08_04780 [Flavobacteriaceae bacterium]|nr:hypothetical protein [Flavobacteriaceae bacterium]
MVRINKNTLFKILYIIVFGLFIAVLLSCKPKTKVDLHLELGLKYLNNTVKINKLIDDSIFIKKVGVIRDKKKNEKTIIFQLKERVSKQYLIKKKFVVELKEDTYLVNYNLDSIVNINGYYFIIAKINFNHKNTIDTVKTSYNKQQGTGTSFFKLNNLKTNND